MKNKLRSLPVILIMSLMLLSLFGCTTNQEDPITDETQNSPADSPIDEDTTNENTDVDASGEAGQMRDLTALEVARLMGNGTNLGNTMEAYGRKELGLDADTTAYETLWGQPVTTREMIQGMKDAGFDSLRIPVAWTNTMDFENGDYTIAESYLDRVEEIANYALDADMYVIINDHWDGGWWGMFGSATEATRNQAMDLYIAMWTQVGERFKNYSDMVILEAANEELGHRLNDADIAADSGTLSEDECYQVTTQINQAFVDTIRGQGGNNAKRFLLIAGYNTDIEKTCDERYIMPVDTIDNKLLLSVHYYTPWSYCGTSGMASWGYEKDYNLQNELLGKLTKFTDQGIGIILGEYAVLPMSDGSLKNNTLDFTKNFLDNCDLYGYVPMLWDHNLFYIKEDLKINDTGLANLFLERSFAAQANLTEDEVKANGRKALDESLAIAIENDANRVTEGPVLNGDEDAIAWIMFNSNDYSLTYSVGDLYNPTTKSDGIVATDVQIEGPGTYTVGLDFTGTAAGFANTTSFSALGISNGELLFPGYLITIKEVLLNGQPYALAGIPYTAADDGICTRVNLYNGWVNQVPPEARIANENQRPFLSATILDPQTLGNIETLTVTFEYGPAQ